MYKRNISWQKPRAEKEFKASGVNRACLTAVHYFW